MVGWSIVMGGIMLIGVSGNNARGGHIVYWQQQRQVEQRRGEAASWRPDCVESRQTLDSAIASMECIDSELSRLAGSKGSVGQHTS
jgi:hypothetical protein